MALASAVLWFGSTRQGSTAVEAAASRRAAFLIRFGQDGGKDVDWSGSIEPAPARIAGWQLDAADEAAGARWKCSTREQRYWDTPYERNMRPTSNRDRVTTPGVVVEYDLPLARPVEVRTAQGAFTFAPESSLWESPRKFLDGRVEVRAAPATSLLDTGPAAEDDPSLVEARDGTLWMAYLRYDGQGYDGQGDQVYVRRRSGDAWSEPEPLGTAGGDCFRTAIAQDRAGRVWVAWSAQVAGNFDLYARAWDGKRWSSVERLTDAPGSDIYHALASDRQGNLHLAWQSSRAGNFDIYRKMFDGKSWSRETPVSADPANEWEPALAASPDGAVTLLWDTYAKGSYDVVARTWRGGALGPLVAIAETGAFEARPSARYDSQGRLWIAWEEGDWNWGKDYGMDIPESGRGLLVRRQVRVGVLAGGRMIEPIEALSVALPEDFRQAFLHPRLRLDSAGNPWVFFRYRVNLPQNRAEGGNRAVWRMGASRYQGGRWIPMIPFPEGQGRIDASMAVEASRDGHLYLAAATDSRRWSGAPADQDLYFTAILAGASAPEPALGPIRRAQEAPPVSHAREAEDVRRARAYRAAVDGSTLRIVRGDLHRHTDISWDGNRDGSLHDAYRYALDAAAFDYLGVCDHQAGNMIPYNWWMIQKAVDLFTIRDRFIPVYSYERSLSYPNGHRNVLFAVRGRPVLAIPEAERRGEEGAAKLYEYLRRMGGVTTSHTSATGMGTDWRDSDAEVEPVVEIYQGYRRNYEGPQTPRAPTAREAARFSDGYVWNAWAKGIKLGVQSSSDHVSTHISYAAFYVDRMERAAILEAAKARRSFAATDNLVIDFRMGGHFMGASFAADRPQAIQAHVAGTAPIARVDLIRGREIIYTAPGSGAEARFTFTDTASKPGEHYYYIRVEQSDGQVGWSSPIWVTYP